MSVYFKVESSLDETDKDENISYYENDFLSCEYTLMQSLSDKMNVDRSINVSALRFVNACYSLTQLIFDGMSPLVQDTMITTMVYV